MGEGHDMTSAPDLDRWERDQDVPILKDARLAHESPEWREAAENKQLLLQGEGRLPKVEMAGVQEQVIEG